MNISERINSLDKKLLQSKVERDSTQASIDRVSNELSALRSDVEDLEKIHGVITMYAQAFQENFLNQIEEVVTKGLQSIFEQPMRFKVHQTVSGKRLEVRFSLITGLGVNELETGIMDARGGGVGAVVGFLLRVAVLLLVPNQRKLLVLDETFAQLSEEYLPNLSEFIRQLVNQTGIQIVMVTHQPELALEADTVYNISHDGTKTVACKK